MSATTGTVAERLRQAISVGAPQYNAGSPADCLRTYINAALEVTDSKAATAGEQAALRSAVERATNAGSPDEGAWIMRRAFDSILSGAVAAQERAAGLMAQLQSLPPGSEYDLLSFEAGLPGAPRWRIMDDTVMGGMSQSDGLSHDPSEGAAVFSGRVTTDGGGGFASLRSDTWDGFAVLGAAKGVRLMVKGDGRQYKINAKTEEGWDGVMYQHDFVAPTSWGPVDLAFKDFKPTFRGRAVSRPPLQGGQIRQMGLMVSKFTADGGTLSNFRNGGFRLGLRWIKGLV